jgi:signal transduction histidine kinase
VTRCRLQARLSTDNIYSSNRHPLRTRKSGLVSAVPATFSRFLRLQLAHRYSGRNILHWKSECGSVRRDTLASPLQLLRLPRLLQDEERRKFARELHDSVGQQLAAAKMALSALQRKLPGDVTLQDCIKLVDDSIAETRTISHLLHPPLRDEAVLSSASRWCVEGFGRRSGIDVKLDLVDGLGRLPDATELVLFRVLREGLTNVHRHSGAKKRADVSLQTADNQVILRVRDYGNGMPPIVPAQPSR